MHSFEFKHCISLGWNIALGITQVASHAMRLGMQRDDATTVMTPSHSVSRDTRMMCWRNGACDHSGTLAARHAGLTRRRRTMPSRWQTPQTPRMSLCVYAVCDMFGLIGPTFRDLDRKMLIFFNSTVLISPNAWYISRCPMPLNGVECQVSASVDSDTCPRPTAGRRAHGRG